MPQPLPPPYFLNNSDTATKQIINSDQQVDETEYTDQLDYIRNDVAKQDGVTDSVASIKLSSNASSLSESSAALVTKTDGTTLLYMWGDNRYGQLGFTANTTPNPTPTLVTALSGKRITQVALGKDHSAALLEYGSLYVWGRNNHGQLGNGTATDDSKPTQVAVLSGKTVTQIALGYWHSAALLKGGSLYMWGYNYFGQLGNGSLSNKPTPTPVAALSGKKIVQIALGERHSAALLDDDSLYMWGRNNYGQLGNGTIADNPTPAVVTALSGQNITKIALGSYHSAALLDDDSLYMWGQNDYGQLGFTANGSTPNPTPTQVAVLSGKKITQIALGEYHSAALLDDGSLYMWGYNGYGQLGNGSLSDEPTPTLVTALSGKTVTQVALGKGHSAALLEDGSLYMWGNNSYGKLGNGEYNQENPVLSSLGKDSHITANTAITAYEAIDKLWVDNKFNLSGFKNSFNLVNIPDGADQVITMDKKPTPDNVAKTVTMNVKIKFYYDENGLIVADTAAKAMTIGGFKEAMKTNIAVKTDPLNSVVVDKWMDYVTVDRKINRTKLQEFLVLTDVPADAEFSITESNAVNKTGVLTFKIATNKVINWGGSIINTPSDFAPFPITLNLTPRITKMTAITPGSSSLTAAALKAKLFDDTELVKDLTELQKYMTIIAPVDNVQYHLATWNQNDAEGTVEFSVYASKYYDNNAIEQTGGASVAASKVSFNLKLQPETSSITLKTTLPNVRIDKFEAYIKNNGSTIVRSKLEEFFVLTNVPSAATFTAKFDLGEYDTNNVKSLLKLKLTIDKFNQGSPATPQTSTQDFELTLTEQHAPTRMQAKPAGSYDQNISVMQFFRAFTDASNNVTDRAFLEQYINIHSLPANANLTVVLPEVFPNDGQVKFKISSDQAYDDGSDLTSTFESPQFTLDLLVKKQAPAIAVNSSIVNPIKPEEFVSEVNKLSGTSGLSSYLFNQYLTITGDVPPDNVYYINQASADSFTGEVDLQIYASHYYDVNDDIQIGSYATNGVKLALQLKGLPSKIAIKAGYPTDLRVDKFVDTIQPNGTSVNRSDLEKYFSLTNVPNHAVFKLTNPKPAAYINGVRKTISFDLTTSIYNSADGVSGTNTQNFSLTLSEQHAPTTITLKPAYDHALKVEAVQSQLTTLSGQALVNYLNRFLDIQSIPSITETTVTVLSADPTTGELSFEVKLPQVYDANSELVSSTPGQFKFTLSLGITYPPTDITIKQGYTQVRIDQFASQIVNLKGQALYDYLVPSYLTATSIYDPTKLAVRVINQDYQTGEIQISITIDAYYNTDSNLIWQPKTYSFEYVMIPKYQPTSVSALTTYPRDLAPSAFKAKLVDGGAVVAGDQYTLVGNNIIFLKKFLKFEAIPANTVYTLTINTAQTSDDTGILSFNLSLNQYYSADGDLKTEKYDANNLVFNLLATSNPDPVAETKITTKANSPLINSAQGFIDSVYANSIVDENQLGLYVDGLNTIPTSSTIKNITTKATVDRQVTFSLTVDGYYNSSGVLVNTAMEFDFNLTLTQKYAPTQISVLAAGSYPTDYTPSQFQARIIKDGASLSGDTYTLSAINLVFLSRFIAFNSVPPTAVYKLMINHQDDSTGVFSFNLFIDQYYDANGELITNVNQPYNDLVLQLAVAVLDPEIKPMTNLIDHKQSIASVDAFMNLIKDSEGNLIFSQLSIYVGGLASIPTDAIVSVSHVSTNEGTANFAVVLSGYYDGKSPTMINEEKTFNFTVNVDYISPKTEANAFPWWWILVGIGGAAIIGVLTWLIIKKQKERQTVVKRILQQRAKAK